MTIGVCGVFSYKPSKYISVIMITIGIILATLASAKEEVSVWCWLLLLNFTPKGCCVMINSIIYVTVDIGSSKSQQVCHRRQCNRRWIHCRCCWVCVRICHVVGWYAMITWSQPFIVEIKHSYCNKYILACLHRNWTSDFCAVYVCTNGHFSGTDLR